jgi:hypothetical protein
MYIYKQKLIVARVLINIRFHQSPIYYAYFCLAKLIPNCQTTNKPIDVSGSLENDRN